jgi:cytochrome c-type biogenesis protein CcmH
MTLFWIFATLMVAVALLFFVPGLLRGPRTSIKELGHSVATHRQQLQSLELAHRDGHLNKKDYQSRRQEISDAMMAAMAESPQPAAADRSPVMGVALAFMIPILTVFLYLQEGTPEALGDQPERRHATSQPQPQPDAGQQQAPELGEAIAGLIARLNQNPEDIEGWLLLGRSYMSMQNYAAARDALQHAHDLDPNEPVIMIDLAESIAFSSGQRELPETAYSLLERALLVEPTAQKALWLMGLGKYQQGDFQDALGHWEQLLSLLEPGSPVADTVTEQINNAREQLGAAAMPGPGAMAAATPVAAATQAPTAAGQASRSLTVEVSLSAELGDRVRPSDTLFVFARPVTGPKMPLAIQRLTAGQLPLTVTLDDTMGMMPQMNLATFPEVVVGARISRSGDATPQPGDLEVLSGPIANNQQQPVRLEINTVR